MATIRALLALQQSPAGQGIDRLPNAPWQLRGLLTALGRSPLTACGEFVNVTYCVRLSER